MNDQKQLLSDKRGLRTVTLLVLTFLLLARIGYGVMQNNGSGHAMLQGNVYIEPLKPLQEDHPNKIQPGGPVKVKVVVENKGSVANSAGKIFIRYAFAKPLHQEESSVLFESESKDLPAIEPGKEIEISFTTPHQTPSIADFVRHDWALRDYQAVVQINNEEQVIGTVAMTFSAYYYPGVRKQFPKSFNAPAPVN
ncbi:MAG: hypothetical protein Q8K60_00835 [Parachlamydiaceae bacterium]|nr:hypothetical protein [Parachlamydiaceae bacterium]